MPIYQYNDNSIIIKYGHGDLVSIPGKMFEVDPDEQSYCLSIYQIQPGEIGREIDNTELTKGIPPVTIAFKSVEALDIVIANIDKLKKSMLEDKDNK